MARPKNPNKPPKKAAKGRKYLVMTAEEWENFKGDRQVHESLDAAQNEADRLATEADDTQPGVAHRFAIVEEAGILSTEVQKKVSRNFVTSRQIIREPKAETPENAAPSTEGTTEGSTTEGSTSEETGSRRKGRHRE